MKNLLSCLFLLAVLGTFSFTTAPKYLVTSAPEEYAGTYQFKNTEFITNFVVKVSDGALYGEADSHGSNKLLPQDKPDVFKSTSQYGSLVTFKRDPSTRKVVGLVLHIMDTDMEAVRKE
ncbi:DUF3471 domain-containing protein [Telluribacter humicola]|uniref:DUF3471 domain-containing protein n=1 Tax=Telluribacter humicola TaxID=1720261 RepID=UPI001A9603C9|nr:DUF3471 domain-containing protein [Telluribacter humicola]